MCFVATDEATSEEGEWLFQNQNSHVQFLLHNFVHFFVGFVGSLCLSSLSTNLLRSSLLVVHVLVFCNEEDSLTEIESRVLMDVSLVIHSENTFILIFTMCFCPQKTIFVLCILVLQKKISIISLLQFASFL